MPTKSKPNLRAMWRASSSMTSRLSVVSRMSRLRSKSRPSLVAPGQGFLGTAPGHQGQPARDDADREEHEQGHPVLRVFEPNVPTGGMKK